MQTQTSNTLHNAIMEAGSKDRPPMLAPGNYVQWKSRIKRYIDTKPNHELIHYCLKNLPYELVDACPNACEMWKAIKRLKQGELINVQDLETNLYWEFRKFTSQDDINNNMQTQTSNTLHNAIMKSGSKDRPSMLAPGNYVQWKSIIKRYIDTKHNHELIHYYLENPPYELGWKDKRVPNSDGNLTTTTERVFETYKNVTQDIRYQLNAKAEAVQIILTGIDNDIYSTVDACPNACEMWKAIERLKHDSTCCYPLALVAQQQLVYHPQTYPTHYKQNSSTRSQQAATRNKGKAIVNSPQPIYDQEPSMADDDDETSKDKEIDKLMALISLSFKKIYKPTNNNLRTSSNTSRANQDNSPRINRNAGYESQRIGNVAGARETVGSSMDNSPRINRNAGYESQRIGNVAGARETVGSSMVQKSRIQCYNCKEFGHVARECQKPKRAKDAGYHREKMLLCKQEEAGI
nr:hypothetical protein [Tanacetum cinerariifolium]